MSNKTHRAKPKAQPRATLTLKQQLFVEAYIGPARGNATEAARKAGYTGNDATLAQVAAENMRRPQILALINSRVEEVAMTADEILAELADIARLPCPGPVRASAGALARVPYSVVGGFLLVSGDDAA